MLTDFLADPSKLLPNTDVIKSPFFEQVSKVLSSLKDGMDSEHAYLQEQWKAMVTYSKSNQQRMDQQVISEFGTYNVARAGTLERAAYYAALQAWYLREVGQIQPHLLDCESEIVDADRDLQNQARDSLGVLISQAKLIENSGTKQSISMAVTDPSRYGPMVQIVIQSLVSSRLSPELESCKSVGQYDKSMPVPPVPGSSWGPFRPIGSWLLQTQSMPLTILTGMIGFGLLGSIASVFLLRLTNPDTAVVGGQTFIKVFLTGFSAALIVFLLVEGGLALVTTSAEPNAYVLFFACLVGSSSSERVWTWAKNYIDRILPNDSEQK